MIVTGTVKCLHCGYTAGDWIGPAGSPLVASGLRNAAAGADGTAVVRCARCQGPTFLDEATTVRSSARLRRIARLRQQIAELEVRRRPNTAA